MIELTTKSKIKYKIATFVLSILQIDYVAIPEFKRGGFDKIVDVWVADQGLYLLTGKQIYYTPDRGETYVWSCNVPVISDGVPTAFAIIESEITVGYSNGIVMKRTGNKWTRPHYAIIPMLSVCDPLNSFGE